MDEYIIVFPLVLYIHQLIIYLLFKWLDFLHLKSEIDAIDLFLVKKLF